ncbi:hypothetical protein [Desulfuromonas thiophila]|uniref:Uncharacterized protein n=1 Tax=Desulfuromonas thiophila TaxID=57664 RepID=A0A1G7DR67_9BACT|nr:hypothetical protein [Desulfuromonas thiophila]SDE53967.1 hypothetical protein SAMN05661003_11518 [Desulfuromonas thiophila]
MKQTIVKSLLSPQVTLALLLGLALATPALSQSLAGTIRSIDQQQLTIALEQPCDQLAVGDRVILRPEQKKADKKVQAPRPGMDALTGC